jgi:ATP-binding cassette subfamily C protein CydD
MPESGRITINGQDLTDIDMGSWRSKVAWVSQTPYFIAGTVRENLLLGCPDATAAEIQAALEAAAAYSYIAALPDGLNTVLGDRGAGLSGGDLKRLALARAYLRQATCIILDEPTAGLDPENEQLVCEALQKIATGRTVLVISHREQTLSYVERVAEMVDGQIVRVTTAADYMAKAEITL